MSIIRDITLDINDRLLSDEILLLIGARQVGKTTVLYQVQEILEKQNQTTYFLNLEDPDYLTLLKQSPKNLFKIFPLDLKQKHFILIDEVQYLSDPSNFLKYFYDEYREKIKIIASGSSAFYLDKKFNDSLAGRKEIFYLHTLSFREFLRFKDELQLAQKNFHVLAVSEREKLALYYQEYLSYGGYPRVVLSPLKRKEDILRDLAYSYIKKDIYDANIRQDEIFYRLLKILASQTGNLVNSSELASTLSVSKTAIDNYLYVMQKSFHICLVKPFFKNMRKELTKMPKVFFLDLGLRNFFVKDFKPFAMREDKGAILENAVLRQLIEKYDLEEIKFWRTVQKKEIDFVVNEAFAFEVKSQPTKFRKRDYQTFVENYPKIELAVVSFEAKETMVGSYRVLEAWQI